MNEELTDAMHATFTISNETDRKHRVWSSMELEATGDYTLSEALEMQQVTMVDYELFNETYPPTKTSNFLVYFRLPSYSLKTFGCLRLASLGILINAFAEDH